MRISTLLILLVLTGCSQAITMRHPDGRTASCGGYAFHAPDAQAIVPAREAQCVRDFKEQGFTRQP